MDVPRNTTRTCRHASIPYTENNTTFHKQHEGGGESDTSPQSFLWAVTCISLSRVGLARSSHVAVPSFKGDEEGNAALCPEAKESWSLSPPPPSTVHTVTHRVCPLEVRPACPPGRVLTRHSAVTPFLGDEAEATAAGLSHKVTEGQQWGAPFLGSKGYRPSLCSPATQPGLGGHPEEMKTGPCRAQWGFTIRQSGSLPAGWPRVRLGRES